MLTRIALITLLLGAALWLSVDTVLAWPRRTSVDSRRVTHDAEQRALLLSGVQLLDRGRYALTLLRPNGAGVSNLKVLATLPANSDVVDTFNRRADRVPRQRNRHAQLGCARL
jgi:hypothetical protein